MNIVLVSYEFPPQFGGGIGTYVEAMTRILAARGHGVTVVTVTNASTPHREWVPVVGGVEGAGISVVRLPLPQVAGADPWGTIKFWQAHSDHVSGFLQKLTRDGSVDVIEFADYRAEAAAYLADTKKGNRPPVVVKLHTPLVVLNRYNRNRAQWKVIEQFENEPILAADYLVSPSHALANEMRQLLPEIGPIDILPYALDAKFINADRTGVPEEPEILYVGRMEERKGVQTLIDAAPAVLDACPGAKIRMIGGDTPLSSAEPSVLAVLKRSLPEKYASRVIFEQNMPRDLLLNRYKAAKVCVFPSLFENFPNVCLESMLIERCIVGGSNTGMAEMMEHGNSGFIFPSGDAKALAETLIHAYQLSTEERRAIGKAARERALALYEPSKIAQDFENLYASYTKRTLNREPVPRVVAATPKKPTIAVVLPCYNHGRYVADAIDSIRAQTHQVDDIVIVDDGSNDPFTIDILPKVAVNGVRLIRQENQGLAAARNTGIRATNTDYFVALDADDRIAPTFVEKLLAPLVKDSTLGYCYSYAQYFGSADGCWHCPPYNAERLLVENMSVATAVVRRAAFNAAGPDPAFFPNGDIGYQRDMVFGFEDWDFWLALLSAGYQGHLVPEPLFHYRKHAGGSMLSRTQARRAEMVARMAEHHRSLYHRLMPFAVTEKDRLFFADHMALWQLREAVAKAGNLPSPPPADEPVGGVQTSAEELSRIERSVTYRTVQALKSNPIYKIYATRRYGNTWHLEDPHEPPSAKLERIKSSRSFKLIQAMKRTSAYKAYATLKYGEKLK